MDLRGENDDDNVDCERPAPIEVFASRSTLHGIAHMFTYERLCVRRCLWIIFFAGSLSFLVFVCADRVRFYLQYPHVTKLDEISTPLMTFPAVTFCNLNSFRFSRVTRNDLYHAGELLALLNGSLIYNKYLRSTVQSNGECGKEVKKRVQAGWNGWRKVWGVLCDRKISARIKGKVYSTVVRPAMLYGLETVSLRKRQESELEVAELKMLRFSLEVTRLDRIRNEYIRGTAHVGRLRDKVREAGLRWFGHVQRRESEYIGRRMLDMELPGRRQRGRPKRRYMDGINEDMKLVGARVEDAEDRDRWREMIRCDDP
ncbi:hypothetical protein QTP70_017201 [Hemibagrus guttatus]|uniref:Uncharacterized protein n=1 Tax=Hemibagrus guttatus TaxID=175788 RepID=A0AAE0Q2V7_9TELE|nr:hypothetical protein QTP70_017201 [Hemibagrus guttatus]